MDDAGGPLSLQFRNQKLRAAEIAQVRDSSAALKSLPRRRSQSKFAVLQVCTVEMAFCDSNCDWRVEVAWLVRFAALQSLLQYLFVRLNCQTMTTQVKLCTNFELYNLKKQVKFSLNYIQLHFSNCMISLENGRDQVTRKLLQTERNLSGKTSRIWNECQIFHK